MKNFGPVLKSVRMQYGLSQGQLAGKIGSTQRHVSFLETGRSQPTRSMIGRLTTELGLSAGQRAALFDASGFTNPYPRRDFSDAEIVQTLDMLEARVLAHWPFPAFVLSADWTILRLNAAAKAMFAPFLPPDNTAPNMLMMLISPEFLTLISNWEEASTALYFRLVAHADRSPEIARRLEELRTSGLFDHIPARMGTSDAAPIFVPIELSMPGGLNLRVTSVLGNLASIHDALVEGFDIEFVMPIDAASEAAMLTRLAAAAG